MAPHDPHASDIHSGGMHAKWGPLHDLLATIMFAGRRRRVYRQLAAASGARPGDRVLDVGCGDGYLTRLMAEAVAPGGSALGVDPSAEAIARARQVSQAASCSFSGGVAQALDAADGTYDVVVSSLALHHVPDALREQAVAEMFRVLRRRGRLLVAEFRPPRTGIGRAAIRPVTSAAMRHNPIQLLVPMLDEAGFAQVESGDLRPWVHYVRARKP